MKQLQRLILILSCICLPFVYGGVSGEYTSPHDQQQSVSKQTSPFAQFNIATLHKFNLRNRGLLDFNEFFLTVSSIRIRPLFVYIHPHYKGFAASIISVSVSLSDWRGPPVA